MIADLKNLFQSYFITGPCLHMHTSPPERVNLLSHTFINGTTHCNFLSKPPPRGHPVC